MLLDVDRGLQDLSSYLELLLFSSITMRAKLNEKYVSFTPGLLFKIATFRSLGRSRPGGHWRGGATIETVVVHVRDGMAGEGHGARVLDW